MNENVKKLLDGLSTALDAALVGLCSIQVSGPGVVTLAGAMQAVSGAMEKYKLLRDELENLEERCAVRPKSEDAR